MLGVGKRDFLLNTSKYLSLVEKKGLPLIVNHRNKPVIKITPLKPKAIKDLAGLIKQIKIKGNINDPIFPGYDSW